MSAGLRLQDEPICSSYWETYVADDTSQREEDALRPCDSSLYDDVGANLPDVEKSSAPSVSTNPFDTDEEDLAL